MEILYFLGGTILGGAIYHIATMNGANTLLKGINVIIEPQELLEEEESDQGELMDDPYSYNTYEDYIKDLEQEED
jgi:hypothetical protein